jgi:type I restriction enzyme M protein
MKATNDVWFYEIPIPEGRKSYSKTQPMQFEEFNECLKWWKKRKETENAWKVSATDLLASGCNLDQKNPNGRGDILHQPPEQLVSGLLKNEKRILELLEEVQDFMKKSAHD